MFNVNESRYQPRLTVDCQISYTNRKNAVQKTGSAINISGTGILIVTNDNPDIGDIIDANIRPGTDSIPALSINFEVIRVTPSSSPEQYEIAGVIINMT